MMKRSTYVLAGAAGVLLAVSTAGADLVQVDFDDVTTDSGMTMLGADHYRDSGLVFGQEIGIFDLSGVGGAELSDFLALGGTAPNAMVLSGATSLSLDAWLVGPGTDASATTDYVSVLFYDVNFGTSLGTLEAYDLEGGLIASVSHTTPFELGRVFEIAAPGIHRIRLSTDHDGAVIDNITFDVSAGSVPGPASIALLAGAGVLRRRRRAH